MVHLKKAAFTCLVLVFALLLSLPAWAAGRGVSAGVRDGSSGKRVALVIGNGKYQGSPLQNSVNDATAMAQVFRELGFNTTLATDLDQRGMEQAISRFGDQLAKGGVAVFYYAGHGVQVGGRNFLMPVGKPIRRQADIRYDAVDAGRIVDRMEQARPMLSLIILDACRNNPFRGFRGGGQGLAPMSAGEGTIIAYATAPGSVAADGRGDNSPYTQALVKAMLRPGLSVERVFKEAAREVKREYPSQVPWVNSSFTGEYYFKPGQGQPQRPVQLAGGPGPAADHRQENIARLLSQAEADLNAGRLTSPPGNNAYDRYQKVLSLEPMNAAANQGLKRIVGKYASLAEGRIRARDFAKADDYLARAEKVSEGDSRVLALRDELRRARQNIQSAELERERRAEEQAKAKAARQEQERLEAARRRRAQEGAGVVSQVAPASKGYQAGAASVVQYTKSGKVPSAFKIKDPAFQQYKKAPVYFTHKNHSENYRLACIECHHVYSNGINVFRAGDKVERCSMCHTSPKKNQGKLLSLYNAFHKNCRDCHKQAGRGPLKCNQCHPR